MSTVPAFDNPLRPGTAPVSDVPPVSRRPATRRGLHRLTRCAFRLALVSTVALVTGCVSAPTEVLDPVVLGPFDPSANSVTQIRIAPLEQVFIDSLAGSELSAAEPVISRTERVIAALYGPLAAAGQASGELDERAAVSPGSEQKVAPFDRDFDAVVEGRFPVAAVRLRMRLSRDWRGSRPSTRGAGRIWTHRELGIQIAPISRQEILVSAGRIEPLIATRFRGGGLRASDRAILDLTDADLFFYVPSVAGFGGPIGQFPMSALWITGTVMPSRVTPPDDALVIGGHFELDGEREARLFTLALRLLLTSLLRNAEIDAVGDRLSATELDGDGRYVRFSDLELPLESLTRIGAALSQVAAPAGGP